MIVLFYTCNVDYPARRFPCFKVKSVFRFLSSFIFSFILTFILSLGLGPATEDDSSLSMSEKLVLRKLKCIDKINNDKRCSSYVGYTFQNTRSKTASLVYRFQTKSYIPS